jgi:hypothetical protein
VENAGDGDSLQPESLIAFPGNRVAMVELGKQLGE